MKNAVRDFLSVSFLLCVMFMSSGTARAAAISGTVSYGGSATGRVYLYVYTQDGNQTGLGTSITPPEPYTIRGVWNGNYIVKAFMDTLGFGVPNTIDPFGQSTPVTISGTDQSGIAIPLLDASPTLPPPPPQGVMVTPGAGSALVMWKPANDSKNFEAAQSYNVYWSTCSDVMGTWSSLGGHVTGIPARSDGHTFLPFSDGSVLYFAVTGQIGTSSISTTAAVTPIPVTIGALSGGSDVSGTVSFSGTPPIGPLFIGINPPDGGPISYAVIPSPTYPQSYTVSGVPAGSYTVFAFIDANSNGRMDLGDIRTSRSTEPLILVSGPTLPGVNIQLNNNNASISTTTTHNRNSSSDSYGLQFQVNGLLKLPVTVTLNSGPNISGPLNLGLNEWGEFQYNTSPPAQVLATPITLQSVTLLAHPKASTVR